MRGRMCIQIIEMDRFWGSHWWVRVACVTLEADVLSVISRHLTERNAVMRVYDRNN